MWIKRQLTKILMLSAFFVLSFSSWDAFADCTGPAAKEGQMQWVTSDVRYCNGTSWVTMNNGTTGATCTKAGEVRYVSGEIVYCNGANFIRTSPIVNHGACAGTDAGRFYYATVGKYYWFCNGSNWRRMAN